MDPDLVGTEAEPAGPGGYAVPTVAAELAALGFADAIEIGRGGFGAVYRCTQVALGRVVAVKVVAAECQDDRARFVREQQAMATLTGHPNIVPVLQIGQTTTSYPFLVMPFCRLGSWQERIAVVGALGMHEVLKVGVKIAGALECAHQAGVIHRDVKPGNVLPTDYGEPALSDFGISRIAAGFTTAPGIFYGSPAFTAPELLGGASPSPSSDVYGLGASLFTGLTGRAPFERRHGEQLQAHFVRITTGPLPDLRAHDVPADLAAVIELTMARDPDKRPSAVELGRQLQQVQARHGLAVDEMVLQGGAGDGRPRKHITPSPGPAGGRRTNAKKKLPALSKNLVGRHTELSRVHELLRCSRVVTVIGTGGVGKTTLVIHAAHQQSVYHPDGVWLVELGELREGSQLIELVAVTLDIPEQASRPPIEGLVDALSERRALIVLDNCEQVIDEAAELVGTLLPRCPQLRVLATSREVLAVGGEAVLALSPLACPGRNDVSSVRVLADNDAVAMFIRCARAAVPEFELTDQNADAVAYICARLDGLPVAIELAAAQLPVKSVQQIGDELCDSHAVLSLGRNAPTHQRSLNSSIESSYDLCSDHERQVWALLSVFSDSFDLSAARYVSGGHLSAREFLDVLCALVDKSILIRVEDDGVVRFRLLNTLRAYGRSRTPATERRRLGRRHASWYHQLVCGAGADRPDSQEVIGRASCRERV
ncbi:hypothetical protein MGAST_23595 [Mycobacterium gastri 'Wayne']|nr:hypothetical protein MGAST_23595 [Mycobacterium gastri 'Wayne']